MDWISILLLAVGLAMDAFAVSISSSITLKKITFRGALKIASYFGLFQALMPLVGWMAVIGFRSLIQNLDHWIAFGLLAAIGGKMIWESVKMEEETPKSDPLNTVVLLGLAIATSIDALAAGVSFGVLKLNILLVVSVIGVITFVLSFIGTEIGNRLGRHFGSRVELVGGLILIGIGTKILIQHLVEKI